MALIECFTRLLIKIVFMEFIISFSPEALSSGYKIISLEEVGQKNCNISRFFQSPINIVPSDTVRTQLPPLEINQLTTPTNTNVHNTGTTFEAVLATNAFLSGGPLVNTYSFGNLHFHWGASPAEGSEHVIDGVQYSMEAHFVFSRTYPYNVSLQQLETQRRNYYEMKCMQNNQVDNSATSMSQNSRVVCGSSGLENPVENETINRAEQLVATSAGDQYIQWLESNEPCENPCSCIAPCDNQDSIAAQFSQQNVTVNTVLGVLFAASENAPTYSLLEIARDVIEVNMSRVVTGDYMSEFISQVNFNDYFTYSGSLTTPPFTANVIWIVFRDILRVSNQQLNLLRSLRAEGGGFITENWRELQDLAGRTVYYRQG